VGAVFAEAEPGYGVLVRGVACELESAEAFDGEDPSVEESPGRGVDW
jgi:hypothetical protein